MPSQAADAPGSARHGFRHRILLRPARDGAAKAMALTQEELPGSEWCLHAEGSGPRALMVWLGLSRPSPALRECRRRARRSGSVGYRAVFLEESGRRSVTVFVLPWANAADASLALSESPPAQLGTRPNRQLHHRAVIGPVFPGAGEFLLGETHVRTDRSGASIFIPGEPQVWRRARSVVAHITFSVVFTAPHPGPAWDEAGNLAQLQRKKIQRMLESNPRAGLTER